jgi:hypothetical protein
MAPTAMSPRSRWKWRTRRKKNWLFGFQRDKRVDVVFFACSRTQKHHIYLHFPLESEGAR